MDNHECDTCWYYDYDEEYDEYYRAFSSGCNKCPYYRQGDDYTLARKQ